MTASRHHLILATIEFVRRARNIAGVTRIAIIGSILTDKPHPKDVDLLVTISSEVDIEKLAAAGRRLKGEVQSRNLGADIFLCNPEHSYLGRTCSYRECHVRVACGGLDCRPRSWIRTDLHVVELRTSLIRDPPLIVWPKTIASRPLPTDLAQAIESEHCIQEKNQGAA